MAVVSCACVNSEEGGVFVPSFPWGVSRVCGWSVGIFVFGRNGEVSFAREVPIGGGAYRKKKRDGA
ncbi:MAG TPA: hypothetical protein H9866_08035 [Candidatus Tidjanibacter gallistercoris]|nr:hypothetical protein [Candidatus Tidjanibacter gallistercoris]